MKNILITGPPGIGKTTLVKKIVDNLKTCGIEFDGFYTEEIRNNTTRIGFDIITLDGKRAVLARKRNIQNQDQTGFMPSVGPYSVHLDDFEKLALPILEEPKALLIIDEIGKMELFSARFQNSIRKIVDNKNIRVIATVPLKSDMALVKQLKDNPNFDIITVDYTNRNNLAAKIVALLNTKK